MKKISRLVMSIGLMVCLCGCGQSQSEENDDIWQKVDEAEAAEEDVNLQQVVESQDVETALSDMTLEDDAKANTILGWWWLLIVAVFGGTGYTMYRKFQQKKAAEKIDKTK